MGILSGPQSLTPRGAQGLFISRMCAKARELLETAAGNTAGKKMPKKNFGNSIPDSDPRSRLLGRHRRRGILALDASLQWRLCQWEMVLGPVELISRLVLLTKFNLFRKLVHCGRTSSASAAVNEIPSAFWAWLDPACYNVGERPALAVESVWA